MTTSLWPLFAIIGWVLLALIAIFKVVDWSCDSYIARERTKSDIKNIRATLDRVEREHQNVFRNVNLIRGDVSNLRSSIGNLQKEIRSVMKGKGKS